MTWVLHMKKILLTLLFLTTTAFTCKPAPEGISDITASGFYIDANYSTVDSKLKTQEEKDSAPFNYFLRYVSANADLYIVRQDKSAAICASKWLTRWAIDGAMLGTMSSSQAEHIRKWTLAGLALSYIKIKPELNADDRQVIENWLTKLANASLEFTKKNNAPRNNHYYWQGLAVMATGVATNNDYFIDEARMIYDKALSDIQDDGSLPQELKRRQKALSYHNYALAPLVIMAELAKSKNEDWYHRNNSRLEKLAHLVLRGIADDSWFIAKTDVKQTIPHGGILGWIEFYRQGNVDIMNLSQPLMKQQPFRYAYLGGNLTLLASKLFFNQLQIN